MPIFRIALLTRLPGLPRVAAAFEANPSSTGLLKRVPLMPTACALVCACLLAFMPSADAEEDARSEYLIQPIPTGYVQVHQTSQHGTDLIEWVPQGESTEEWTRMVTTVITRRNRPTALGIQAHIRDGFASSCGKASSGNLRTGEESGYATSLWVHACALNPATGKPEYMWMKAFEGKDALYVVQFAFRDMPSDEDSLGALEYLESVYISNDPVPKRSRAD